MQNYYYQNQTPPVYGQSSRFAPAPQLTPQQLEKRSLRKTANGLGFFVLIYFFVMQQVFSSLLELMKNRNMLSDEYTTQLYFMLQIIASVSSVLLATLFYKIISKKPISSMIPRKRVQPALLFPVVLLGLGAAMLANQIAQIFIDNISVFGLQNYAGGSVATRSPVEIILYVISTAVVPAFAEELGFRGIIMGSMRRFGDPFAIIFSSVLFGAMHGNTTQIVFAFTLGLIFAFVDCKTNSIIPSIIIHFANNFYAVSGDLLGANTDFDDQTKTLILVGIVITICIAGILSFIYLANKYTSFFTLREGAPNGIAPKSCLSLRQKITAGFTTAGVIISLSVFIAEMILYLIPPEMQNEILRSIGFG